MSDKITIILRFNSIKRQAEYPYINGKEAKNNPDIISQLRNLNPNNLKTIIINNCDAHQNAEEGILEITMYSKQTRNHYSGKSDVNKSDLSDEANILLDDILNKDLATNK